VRQLPNPDLILKLDGEDSDLVNVSLTEGVDVLGIPLRIANSDFIIFEISEEYYSISSSPFRLEGGLSSSENDEGILPIAVTY